VATIVQGSVCSGLSSGPALCQAHGAVCVCVCVCVCERERERERDRDRDRDRKTVSVGGIGV
jgi:hypothetical protein